MPFFDNQLKSNLIILFIVGVISFIPLSILEPIIIWFNPKYLLYIDSESIGTLSGTILLFLPFFLISNVVIWHYNKYYKGNTSKFSSSFNTYIPIFIDLIKYSTYIIIFQLFIRDFSRINQNLYLLVIIYFTIIIKAHFKEKNFKKGYGLALSVTLFSLFLFYFEYLMVSKFEYFNIISKTIGSNSLFN